MDIESEKRAAWEKLSPYYQKSVRISTHDVHYGPLAYGENRLHLLGEVKGARVLEVGCGGGQNTIAVARWGAEAFGVDPSRNQIDYARSLAKECGVDCTFEVTPAEDLSLFKNESFDLVFSSHAFGYVRDIEKAYKEVYRTLRKGGIFVLCVGHPYFDAVGWYLGGDPEEPEIRDYLSWPKVTTWQWDVGGTNAEDRTIQMWGCDRTLSQVINPLLESGFILEKMVEQGIEDVAHMSEEEKEEIPYLPRLCRWSGNQYTVQRKLPSTLILRARKRGWSSEGL